MSESVAQYLKRVGPKTTTEIAEHFGWPAAGRARQMDKLREAGLVVFAGRDDTRKGKPLVWIAGTLRIKEWVIVGQLQASPGPDKWWVGAVTRRVEKSRRTLLYVQTNSHGRGRVHPLTIEDIVAVHRTEEAAREGLQAAQDAWKAHQPVYQAALSVLKQEEATMISSAMRAAQGRKSR